MKKLPGEGARAPCAPPSLNPPLFLHYFGHGHLEEDKSMIHSFIVTFGAKYLTGMVTSVPPKETFSIIEN